MKLIVCGGRTYNNYELVKEILDEVFYQHYPNQIKCLVQGGAKGADALGKRWAIENGVPYEQFDAEWDRYGKTAGFVRNQQMLDESGECILVAFPGNAGTFDMMRRAKRAGVPLYNIRDEEDELDREG